MEDIEKILTMIETITTKINDIKKKAEEVLKNVKEIISQVKEIQTKIKEAVTGAISNSMKWLESKMQKLTKKLDDITDKLKTWIKETVTKIANGAKTVILNIVSMLGKVVTAAFPLPFNLVMKAIWIPAEKIIKSAVEKAFNGIAEIVTNTAMAPFKNLI
jgi:predicted nuclease with TOPRIM domain